MHSAPAVSFPVGRSRFEVWLVAVILVSGALVCAMWALESGHAGGRQMVAFMVWMAAAICLLMALRKSPQGLLVWRQEGWFRRPSTGIETQEIQIQGVDVQLDLQFTLLLKLSFAGGTSQWLWLDRAVAPERWLDLRRAVHAPRTVTA